MVILSLISKEQRPSSCFSSGKLNLLNDFDEDMEDYIDLALHIAHTLIIIVPLNTDLTQLPKLLLHRFIAEVFTLVDSTVIVFG